MPRSFDSSLWFLQIFPPVAGALFGGILSLGGFFVLQIASGGVVTQAVEGLSLDGFSLFFLTSLSSLGGNMVALWFYSLANPEEMPEGESLFPLVFLFHIFCLLVSAPAYLFGGVQLGIWLTSFLIPFCVVGTAILLLGAQLHRLSLIDISSVLVLLFALLLFFVGVLPLFLPTELSLFLAPSLSWFLVQSCVLPWKGFLRKQLQSLLKSF